MTPKDLAESVIETAVQAGNEVTFSFDGSDWADQDILDLVNCAREAAKAKDIKLKGVRVGADIFIRLGGSNVAYPNARDQSGTLLVQTDSFGVVELVFRR